MVNFGNDWDLILQDEFKKEYYLNLRSFLKSEYKTHKIYPNMYTIFNCLRCTAYKDVKVVSNEFTNNENTIPANIIVLLDIDLSIFAEKVITENTVISPNKNPTIGSVKLPKKLADNPNTITKPAPKDAPDDTPKVYGDANSFLRVD